MRSVKQKFLHAWHIFCIFVLHFEKNIYTLLVEQVTISKGVIAGWAVTKTNTNSEHGVLWRLHAHAQCPFSRISARAWRMPLSLRHSASETAKSDHCACAHARYAFRRILDWVESGTTTPPLLRNLFIMLFRQILHLTAQIRSQDWCFQGQR